MKTSNSGQAQSASITVRSVLAVSALFVVLGVFDVYRGVAPLFGSNRPSHLAGDDLQVLAVGVTALVGGIYAARRRNWARWLLAGWMALHVAISVGQPVALAAHLVIFGFVAYLLFRSRSSAHFRPTPNR
jgi:hypothetical protein